MRITFLIALFLPWAGVYAQDSGTRLAEFGAQLERLEANLQGVQGAAETQTVQIKQIEENSGRNYRDLEMRLKALEGRVELFQDILNRTVAGVAPKLAEEGKKFQAALDLIREVQYDKAIPAFQQFITQYPKSPSVGEAQFWTAECRFALRDFSQAIKDFQKFAEKYPKSNKTPPAILKQGDAFLQLQMPEEAKVFYKKLVSEYPTTEEAAQAKGKLTALEQKGDMITKLPPPPPQKGPPAPDEF